MDGAPTEENVLRIAVLVKQIPAPAQLRMEDGRAVRTGVDLEVNAYCRRANAKAVELAGNNGEAVVFTMGPPPAEDALREMIACGAHRGVHLCDPAFAGSDTLATARALAAAVAAEGPFDLVLAGLNSLDADTGQVPAETAEMLGLPFEAGIHHFELNGRDFTARLETDDGYRTVSGRLPAMLSTAERLCDPSKAPPEQREQVPAERIRRVTASELGLRADEVGAAIGATRRVTDRGWVPRSRQIGVTGHSVAPRLLIAVGSSGRFNHTVGIRNAGVLMAVNSDPDAEIFDQVDVGLVGEWQRLVPELTAELTARGLAASVAPGSSTEGGEAMETATATGAR